MAFDAQQADRVRLALDRLPTDYAEKRMMGGLIFMVDDKMFCGVHTDKTTGEEVLMARIGPEALTVLAATGDCEVMTLGGRPMRGFARIAGLAALSESELDTWLRRCLDYNPQARRSKG